MPIRKSHGFAQVVERIHTTLRRWRPQGHAGSSPALGTINNHMRLHDLFEDADDEIITRLRSMARRDVVPLFHPRPNEIDQEMRAFLDRNGDIIAAWPRDAMITHAEIGDYHEGRMRSISPLARNINNCVSVRPPNRRYGESTLMVKNDNHWDNKWMPLERYIGANRDKMASYVASEIRAKRRANKNLKKPGLI